MHCKQETSRCSRLSVPNFPVGALSFAERPSPRLSHTPTNYLLHFTLSTSYDPTEAPLSTMADIDMPDVELATSSKSKAPVRAEKSGPSESASDGKKRFEVKKACVL